MSIATRIQSMEEHISDAYNSLSKFGVTANNKNIENIANLVNEIYDNTPKTDYASGTNLTLENTRIGKIDFKDTDNIEKLGLGATNQLIATGKNLWGGFTFTKTQAGLTYTQNNDGSISISGTSSGMSSSIGVTEAISNNIYITLEAGTYTVSGGGSNYDIQVYDTNSNQLAAITAGNTVTTFTLTGGKDVVCRIFINNSGVIYNTNVKLQLEVGSTATSYEPYTGGTVIPNPEYPQDINVVKDNQNILVQNKNLIEEVFKGYNINGRGQFEQVESSSAFDVNIAKVQAGETYILNTTTNVIAYFDTKPTTSSTSYNNAREVITATNTLTPTRSGYIAMRTTTSNTTQLEKGTTATSYVPHQENNYEINLSNKNLFNVNGEWFNINNAIPTVTNNVLKQVNRGSYSRTEWVINNLSANQNYVLKCNYSNPSGSSIQIRILRKNNSTSIVQSDVSTNTSGTFEITATIPEDTCYIRLYSNTTETSNNYTVEFSNIQFEVGSTATSYASYFTPIELCKINTYQDYIYKNGKNWYIHKEIGKVIWNGTESWTANPGISTTYVVARPSDLAYGNNNVLFNYFKIVDDLNTATEGARIGSSINLKNPNTADLASFKSWLSTHNTIMYYQSSTPTETQITDENLIAQLDAWYNAQSMNDITYITVDGNLPMQLKLRALKK